MYLSIPLSIDVVVSEGLGRTSLFVSMGYVVVHGEKCSRVGQGQMVPLEKVVRVLVESWFTGGCI